MTTRLCTVDECLSKHFAKGYCRTHYERFKRNGHPGLVRPGGPCSVDGCENRRCAGSFCKKHYRRWQISGDPLVVGRRGRVVQDPIKRFWSFVTQTDGCWRWTGGVRKDGYGNFWLDGRTVLAHRYSYELNVGPIPDGLTIDHLCRNRRCVNPAHLEAVTQGENNRRALQKDHCKRGHPMSGANLYIDPTRGRRSCRACRLLATNRYRQKSEPVE